MKSRVSVTVVVGDGHSQWYVNRGVAIPKVAQLNYISNYTTLINRIYCQCPNNVYKDVRRNKNVCVSPSNLILFHFSMTFSLLLYVHSPKRLILIICWYTALEPVLKHKESSTHTPNKTEIRRLLHIMCKSGTHGDGVLGKHKHFLFHFFFSPKPSFLCMLLNLTVHTHQPVLFTLPNGEG